MRNIRFISILSIVTSITIWLWWLAKPDGYPHSLFLVFSFGQISGLVGTIWLALTLVLSTRWTVAEDMFGGLDKVYKTHHLLGIGSFVLLVLHPFLFAAELLPDWSAFFGMFMVGSDIALNAGVIGLYVMVFAFLFIALIKLPYHIWLWTHRVLGLAILFGGAHAFLIGSDMGSFRPLQIWMLVWIAIGSVSALYAIIFYKLLGPRYFYRVSKVRIVRDVVELFLQPAAKKRLQFVAGQFVSLQLQSKAVSRESHPFSIVSAPTDEVVRLAAKQLGDYTTQLTQVQPGELAVLYGPNGRLGCHLTPAEVWVAGGIGITPFMSMAQAFGQQQVPKSVTLFYVVRKRSEAVFLAELEKIAAVKPQLKVVLWESSKQDRLSAAIIDTQANLARISAVRLCGPVPMMVSLTAQLQQYNIPVAKIYYEDFAFAK